MKPQTVTFQVSVITCTLRFHSHPRRQDIDPEGRSHAGCCRVNTGISAQSDCRDPVGLCRVWVAVVELIGKEMLWSPALGAAGHEGHWSHVHICSSTCGHRRGSTMILGPGQDLCFSWGMAGRSLLGDSCFFRGVAAFPIPARCIWTTLVLVHNLGDAQAKRSTAMKLSWEGR